MPRPRRWSEILKPLASRLWRSDDGASAAEFAIIVPGLLMMLVGVMDLAQFANRGMMLEAGVRSGAAYALNCHADHPGLGFYCTDNPGDPDAASIKTVVTGANNFAGTVTVTFPDAEGASGSDGYPQFCVCGDGSAITCNNDTENGGALCAGSKKGVYVTIRAVQSGLTPILSWAGFPTSVSRTLTVRVL